MQVIGTIQGAANVHDPGWVQVNVTDAWDVELVIRGQDESATASLFIAFGPSSDSVVALARLLLLAEGRIGELLAEPYEANAAR